MIVVLHHQSKFRTVMKQPELGKKILELRQQRGLTQEELVEQCNISVRTIQRIEAGEVTPRSYTVKTILQVLDFDLEQLNRQESKVENEFKKLMLLKVDDTKEASFLTRQLNIAWIAGIIYFLIGFAEFPADWARVFDDYMLYPLWVYISIKVVVITSFVLFIRGFILCGKIFGNYLLKIASFILILISIIFYGYDIVSLFTDAEIYSSMMIAQSITAGVVGVLFGIAILRLRHALGTIGLVTGIFEIVTYGTFITVLLATFGFVLLIPMIILEIVLLYKVIGLIKTKQAEMN